MDKNQLRTRIAGDGLTAWLIMPEGFDRTLLTPGICDNALRDGGIELNSTTRELIEKFIGQATVATVGTFEAIIARGTPPRHGQNGYVEWFIDQPAEQKNQADAAKPHQDGVSFYDRSVFNVVKVGDVLAKVHHPTVGYDGRDVTGKTLSAKDGKPVDFKHDESILVARDNQALAQASGVLDRSGSTICIRDTIEVQEYVDFNTGNISFNGNVLVHKGVRDCFKIEAERDVEVRGLIEAASITAGGDLRALGGFAGRDQGTANVSGNLHAKYLDAVKVQIRGDLCVEREIINCKTSILGKVNSPNGAIIGGELAVAGAVDIGELGAEGQPVTMIRVGVVPHLDPLITLLSELTASLIAQRQKLLDEQELIQKTSGKNVLAGHKEKLCELMYEIAEVQSQLDRAEPSLAKARERAEAMRSVDLHVNKRVYPNTVLECAGLRYKLRSELKGPVHIRMGTRGQLQVEKDGIQPAMLARSADLSEAA